MIHVDNGLDFVILNVLYFKDVAILKHKKTTLIKDDFVVQTVFP